VTISDFVGLLLQSALDCNTNCRRQTNGFYRIFFFLLSKFFLTRKSTNQQIFGSLRRAGCAYYKALFDINHVWTFRKRTTIIADEVLLCFFPAITAS